MMQHARSPRAKYRRERACEILNWFGIRRVRFVAAVTCRFCRVRRGGEKIIAKEKSLAMKASADLSMFAAQNAA
jgi:hypothetical protein